MAGGEVVKITMAQVVELVEFGFTNLNGTLRENVSKMNDKFKDNVSKLNENDEDKVKKWGVGKSPKRVPIL